MRVVAWNTAAQLRDRQQDIRSIRDQLQVGTVLTGSVRIAGSSLRVRAQLIDTGTACTSGRRPSTARCRTCSPSRRRSRAPSCARLRVQLTGSGEGALAGSRAAAASAPTTTTCGAATTGTAALRKIWRGASNTSKRRSRPTQNSALAHTGLADAHTLLGGLRPGQPEPSGCRRPKPRRCAPSNSTRRLAEAYASLALIRSLYDWEWQEARGLYQRAIELNPGYATARHWLGRRLVRTHRPLRRSRAPRSKSRFNWTRSPASSAKVRTLSRFLEGRYDDAVRGYLELIADDPTFYKAYTSLGRVYAQQGKFQDALRMLEKGRSLAGRHSQHPGRDGPGLRPERPAGAGARSHRADWSKGSRTPGCPPRCSPLFTSVWVNTTGRWTGWNAAAASTNSR